ncbi:MAG: hypothetical protein J0H44_19550 [Alphaproteobacteria bacterium]|nr:hypothetical protein [Alphaproteobacteria bacterium]
MTTLQDLDDAIDDLLDHTAGVQLVHHVAEKAYEAYIFGLCLRAVRELGQTPILMGIKGLPTPFIFRGGPGQIHSTRYNYGYAVFWLNHIGFEIHAGIEFRGTSGMTHEVDVCIVRHDDAELCRQQPDDPPARSLIAGWECKFYGGILDKVLGRAFVGLMDDMGANVRLSGLCSNSSHSQLREYFQLQRRPYPHFELSPINKSGEDIFVNAIKGELKKMTAI